MDAERSVAMREVRPKAQDYVKRKPATARHYVEHFRVLKRVWPKGLSPLRSITVEQAELLRDERGKEVFPGTDRRISATIRSSILSSA